MLAMCTWYIGEVHGVTGINQVNKNIKFWSVILGFILLALAMQTISMGTMDRSWHGRQCAN